MGMILMQRLKLVSVLGLFCLASGAWAQSRPLLLGTGGMLGTNYAAGSALCRFSSQAHTKSGTVCQALISKGTVNNLIGLRTGEYSAGIATPDIVATAYEGVGVFREAGPNKSLRALFSLNPTYLMLVVPKNSTIQKLEDIKGKRFYADVAGSSTAVVVKDLFAAYKISQNDVKANTTLSVNDQSTALCKGEIDAYISNAGAGAKYVAEALACGARILPLTGPGAEATVKLNTALKITTIPPNSYKGQEEGIVTIGSNAVVVSTTQMSADTIYDFVKSAFDNLEGIRKLHPAFTHLDPKVMAKEGLGVPLHEGAERFYREKGWL